MPIRRKNEKSTVIGSDISAPLLAPLVPKLCLGTHSTYAPLVPKLCLGTYCPHTILVPKLCLGTHCPEALLRPN
ncbi:MAG: hypothetical protein GX594_11200 [Pirellulaceae bacterium]|nr:hypothetical protein [Pirellulaceae bacterium]